MLSGHVTFCLQGPAGKQQLIWLRDGLHPWETETPVPLLPEAKVMWATGPQKHGTIETTCKVELFED